MTKASLIVIAGMAIFRVFLASHIPLNDDEMYYWIWSRHLAYGYVDHPPIVAWLIAATSFAGKSALAIRSAFIICLAAAAIAVGRAALAFGASREGASAAAILFALIPSQDILIGEAKPDPPYLLCWALALLFAARAAKGKRRQDFLYLGLALAGATLARFFGWALVAGILGWALTSSGRPLRRGLWLSFAVLGALYAPFVFWNATHHWMNFVFTFAGRQGFALHPIGWFETWDAKRNFLYGIALMALIWRLARPDRALLAWTGLPMAAVLTLLQPFQSVLLYWFFGPVTSLCVALGPWIAENKNISRKVLLVLWAGGSAVTMALLAATAVRPGAFYFGEFAFTSLAKDVRGLGADQPRVTITDAFGVAAPLQFNGIPALLIGNNPEAPQWRQWYGDRVPKRALFVTREPANADTLRVLARTFSHVVPGPVLEYRTISAESRVKFYTAWCDGARLKRFSQ